MTDFDYIIVGAGSAGCVLANRLSADPSVRVALIEAGKTDDNFSIKMPIGYGKIAFEPGFSWHYQSAPEPGLNGRRLLLPRGKGLGGSSNINGLIYIRGQSQDYDHWQSLGALGWSWKDVLPYFLKSESHVDRDGPWHNRAGLLRVQMATERDPTNDAVIRGFEAIGTPVTSDFNGQEQWGAGYYDSTIFQGQRCSAAEAFLRPVAQRANLKIFCNSQVRRILFRERRASGVELTLAGQSQRLSVRRELILAAGTYHTPDLLQRSGLGPGDWLQRSGVEVIADLPGVGANLQDHLVVPMGFRVREGVFSYNAELTGWRLVKNVLRYLIQRRGPMTIPAAQSGAFVKSSASLDRPDIQFHCLPITGDLRAAARGEKAKMSDYPGLTLAPCQLRPESRGHVRMASALGEEPPSVQHNYLLESADQDVALRGMRIARLLAASPPLAPLIESESDPGAGAVSDRDLLDFARAYGSTGYHPIGTCRMGSDSAAVVDPQLRVRGVEGLRVADASVMPSLISGNTNAACIMIGERAADFVLQAGRR